MDFDEISEKAYKRQDLGEYKNIAEKLAYMEMLNLYKDYNNELITKEEASKQKNQIKKDYLCNLKKVNDYYEVFKHQNDIKIKYDSYLIEIEKSQDLEEMLLNSLKFIEIIIQDNNFFERNFGKIKKNN